MKAILYILLICLLESTIFCRKVITRQDQEEDHEKEKPQIVSYLKQTQLVPVTKVTMQDQTNSPTSRQQSWVVKKKLDNVFYDVNRNKLHTLPEGIFKSNMVTNSVIMNEKNTIELKRQPNKK